MGDGLWDEFGAIAGTSLKVWNADVMDEREAIMEGDGGG